MHPTRMHEGSQHRRRATQSATCDASEAEILRGHLVGSAQDDDEREYVRTLRGVPLDKSEGVVKRHVFAAMLGSTA